MWIIGTWLYSWKSRVSMPFDAINNNRAAMKRATWEWNYPEESDGRTTLWWRRDALGRPAARLLGSPAPVEVSTNRQWNLRNDRRSRPRRPGKPLNFSTSSVSLGPSSRELLVAFFLPADSSSDISSLWFATESLQRNMRDNSTSLIDRYRK